MGKTYNQRKFFVLKSIGKHVPLEANRNFNGDYNYKELKKIVKTFRLSMPFEIRKRVSCLQALFSAKILVKVSMPGMGEYIPETISDIENISLGDSKETDAFFSKRRVSVLDPVIAGYHPLAESPPGSCNFKSRWNRVWNVHVESIESLELKKGNDRECSLHVILNNDPERCL